MPTQAGTQPTILRVCLHKVYARKGQKTCKIWHFPCEWSGLSAVTATGCEAPPNLAASLPVGPLSSHNGCMDLPVRHRLLIGLAVQGHAAAALLLAQCITEHGDGLHGRLIVHVLQTGGRVGCWWNTDHSCRWLGRGWLLAMCSVRVWARGCEQAHKHRPKGYRDRCVLAGPLGSRLPVQSQDTAGKAQPAQLRNTCSAAVTECNAVPSRQGHAKPTKAQMQHTLLPPAPIHPSTYHLRTPVL